MESSIKLSSDQKKVRIWFVHIFKWRTYFNTNYNYINFIQTRLNPCYDYVLICRNGKKISKLTNIIFNQQVFLTIGKYINPARYRQTIETENTDKITVDEQSCHSEDQKYMSNVVKIHY